MFHRVSFFVRETFVSLGRNISMTIAGTIAIFVTLSLAGSAVLVTFWTNQGTQTQKEGIKFQIFMESKATTSQIDDMRDYLNSEVERNVVDQIKYLNKDDAYAVLEELFRKEPKLLNAVKKDLLPVSFLITPTDPASINVLKSRYLTRPGVDKINTPDYKDLIQRADAIKRFLLGAAIALSIASIILVLNTVRLAVFARRREIEIMKLVGASNWFVQVPFMAEGAFQGLLGGGLASGVVFFVWQVLRNSFNSFQGYYVESYEVMFTSIGVVVAGAFIGLMSSIIGLRRYLDV
jgi:cell division transport system permease protein